MPDATPKLGLRYLKPSDAPDLSGGLYDLALSIEEVVTSKTLPDGITYRLVGGTSKPWDSAWTGWNPVFGNININGSWSWRYRAGEVEVRGTGNITGGPFGQLSMSLPVNSASVAYADYQDRVSFTRQGDNRFRGAVAYKDAGSVYLDAVVVVTRNGNQVITSTAVTSAVPFTWANGDGVDVRFTFTPA